jgi:exodeoxyribonuclease VII small subunit
MTPPPDTDRPAEATSPGYAAALAELDGILRELEGSAVDVDRLADRVARAAELVAICRDRIGTARLRVEQIVVGLDTPDEPAIDREPGDAPRGESP